MITRSLLSCDLPTFGELSAEILQMGKLIRFQAKGASMHPLLRDGDALLVKPLGVRPIRIGKVVLCSTQSMRVIVHRVLDRQSRPDGTYYLVQGDQAAKPDGWIPQGQIYGWVSAVDRGNTHINMLNPLMQLLGLIVVLRLRYHIGQGKIAHFASKLIRHLPAFSSILS